MQEESIEKARETIIKSLNESDIELFDKLELMTNIDYFLKHYEKETKVKVKKR